MDMQFKLEVFEGPLDLLLHLIEKNKIDIYDIPIVEITEQYMEYIRRMEAADMNVMSEFLLMAATLLDIKCRMLLPRQETQEEEPEDPRQELVDKLLEYKLYKHMSYELRERMDLTDQNFYRKAELPEELLTYRPPLDYDELLSDVNLVMLQEIFNNLLKRQEDRQDPIRSRFGRIEKEAVDLEKKAGYIREYILHHERCIFTDLIEDAENRSELVVTFLVLLEMIKTGIVEISQENIFDDIEIVRKNHTGNWSITPQESLG